MRTERPEGAMPAVRRLAAIVAADVVGYWRRMGVDEKGMNPAARAHQTRAEGLNAQGDLQWH